MKLRYILPCFIAALAMLISCEKDDEKTYLSGLRVSQSIVGLDSLGTPVQIIVTADADWSFEKLFTKIVSKGDGTTDTIPSEVPEWLTVDKVSGPAGETVVTFSGSPVTESYEEELIIVSGAMKQRIKVMQTAAAQEVKLSTCAEVIAGPESKTYRVKGSVTKIANTVYGNWYLQDETGEVYIYGTLDANGATKNFLSLGIEVGDIVTVEGPKTVYNGTVELVDVTVIDIDKSLIKIDSISAEAIDKDGGDIVAYLTNKGSDYSVEIEAAAQDWLFIKSFAKDSVVLHALPNTGGDRSATVTVKTSADGKEYTSQTTIVQKGAIIAATVAEFLAAEVGDTQYRLNGIVSELYYYKENVSGFYIADHSGKVLVYKPEGFTGTEAKVGDVVTVVGKRGDYKGTAQMTSCQLESVDIVVEQKTISEFKALPDNKEAYYIISGTIRQTTAEEIEGGAKDDITQYGNFYLEDANGESVYVYGVLTGWGGKKGEFANLGLTYGDKLTIIAYKTTYKGLIEAVGVYLSHEQ